MSTCFDEIGQQSGNCKVCTSDVYQGWAIPGLSNYSIQILCRTINVQNYNIHYTNTIPDKNN